jgi:hypothetical protein
MLQDIGNTDKFIAYLYKLTIEMDLTQVHKEKAPHKGGFR